MSVGPTVKASLMLVKNQRILYQSVGDMEAEESIMMHTSAASQPSIMCTWIIHVPNQVVPIQTDTLSFELIKFC